MNPPDLTPKQRGYRWPAEWERHRATWLVWPHNRATWPGRFRQARKQFAHFVRTVARFETVELLAVGSAHANAAATLRDLTACRLREIPTNDSWIRDHGPIFLNGPAGSESMLLDWQYNAWGKKYPPYDLDDQVPRRIAALTDRQRIPVPAVLEGGSVDGNGAGLIMTTDRCLLNPNRNPTLNQAEIETYLCEYLCAEHVIWLTGDLPGDDTDSHIDQIGRFVDEHTVLLLDRPDSDVFAVNQQRLVRWSQQTGIPLEVVPLPAPGPRRVDGMWLPASYANFYLVNTAVLVPTFAESTDDVALRRLESCWPDRHIVPVPADDLVFGLGALHCLSQQEPALPQSEDTSSQ